MRIADLSVDVLVDVAKSRGIQIQTGPFISRLKTRLRHLVAHLSQLYCDHTLVEEDTVSDFQIEIVRASGLRRYIRPQLEFILNGKKPFETFRLDLAMPVYEWGDELGNRDERPSVPHDTRGCGRS